MDALLLTDVEIAGERDTDDEAAICVRGGADGWIDRNDAIQIVQHLSIVFNLQSKDTGN